MSLPSEATHWDKPHVEERIFEHLNELTKGIQDLSTEHNQDARVVLKEKNEELISQINTLIPDLPEAKIVDAYDCLESIQEGAKKVFVETDDITRTQEAINSMSDAYRTFIVLLNWEKEG